MRRKGIHVFDLKKKKKEYAVFKMSSYRKPEIQNELPKIITVKLICFFFTKTLTKNH